MILLLYTVVAGIWLVVILNKLDDTKRILTSKYGKDYWICGQYAFETEDLAKRFILDPKPPIIHVREVL